MNEAYNPYASWGTVAAQAETNERASFIRLTYLHLLGAVLAFVGIEAFLLSVPVVRETMMSILGARFGWMMVLGAFIGVSYLATYWANSSTSMGMQYLGLGLYVVAEAVIFVPLIMIAMSFTDATGVPVLGIAAALTIATFVILTAIVFLTGANFSFIGPFLRSPRSSPWESSSAVRSSRSTWESFSSAPCCCYPAGISFTTRATCCISIASANTWRRRWRCSPRWP